MARATRGDEGKGNAEDGSLHWADQMARECRRRVEESPLLKKIVKEKGHIVYDEKTPSGKIHIGSGRGWIIHDAIAKAMKSMGLKGRFILSSDDIDPFDKMNADLPPKYRQYLGMPFMDIPSPEKGYDSFADYYFRMCTDRFEEFGIDAELESTGGRYRKGDFNKAIRTALDKAHIIDRIFEELYGHPLGKLPFNPICEKCGRIGTTVATAWDPDREAVTYTCAKDAVEWAKGCGHTGETSPYDGAGKLPWKVEWAAKWPTVGVVCELAGKDHFAAMGSRDAAIRISDQVYGFPPPYPSTATKTGKGYEFFTVGGKKMSTSKGQGIGFSDITGYVPANMLRYLLIATRPHAVIDFDPENGNDLILLYERFDRTERVYFGAEGANEHEKQKHRRIYELSHIGTIPKRLPPQVQLTHAGVIVQTQPTINDAIATLQELGNIPADLTPADRQYVTDRLLFAKRWIDTFAEEQYRFTLQETVTMDLAPKEKEALYTVAARLKERKWDEMSLHEEFRRIADAAGLPTKEFFRAAYLALIAKERGPKLARFILSIGAGKVAKVLGTIG
ncbi:lysine--tRNA ligase [Candidatus Woesearchaeota archaeon]|nr:lysine--tRNA ligase [Candidatus Woesearchaeota archaeon]